ncbi:MAG TPA: bifunctional adenosylcobinamide kinase/adenosylcobinamide-phosphate guanylyltransferase [Spongiibacteraceae bacterium]|nr:bifunctional adenosylcobinamide kinase/adenosylcobinamide-phosphate guanylyltransferase [Spongiibacteraceae bacterium]
MLELILGGARSGKSHFAEQQAAASGLECIYIATAQAGDAEMAERIRQHREQRGGFAQTIEEPVFLAGAIAEHMRPARCLLVDCLTLWLTNLLLADDAGAFARERAALLQLMTRVEGRILLVSNEVGLGVVPADVLSRRFVDESGRLHQQLAALSARTIFVVAGLPQVLKGPAL